MPRKIRPSQNSTSKLLDSHKKYNREEKIRKIQDVTSHLIETIAINKISTNRIAKEAGVSIGTVYMYFPKGFPSILKSIAEKSISSVIEIDLKSVMNNGDILPFFRLYVEKFVEQHQQTKAFVRACEIAKLNYPKLFLGFESQLEINLSTIVTLFQSIPEFKNIALPDLKENLIKLIDSLDAIVHKHVLYKPLFENDLDLVDFLVSIIQMQLIHTYPCLKSYLKDENLEHN